MFKSNNNKDALAQTDNATTIIGPNIKVEGDFIGEGNITVDGSVVGTLKTTKDVRIGESAKLQADVTAHNAVVSGEIRGNVKIYGNLELTKTARIIGDIQTSVFSVETGAYIKGKCETGIEEAVPESLEIEMKERNKEKKKGGLTPIKVA